MAVYQRIFTVAGVADLHLRFNRVIKEAEAVDLLHRRGVLSSGAGATARELLRAYALWSRELDDLARLTAVDAEAKIVAILKIRQKRPDTGKGPHLRDLIMNRPIQRGSGIATGQVGIADEHTLNRAINPLGPSYGPYWRTIEFGYTGHVGRVLRGFFGDKGGPIEVPRSQYAGGGGPHPIFYPGRLGNLPASVKGGIGPRGGKGGLGTIRHPIRAEHFIRDGSHRAFIDYVAGVRSIENQTINRLSAVIGRRAPVSRRRRRP